MVSTLLGDGVFVNSILLCWAVLCTGTGSRVCVRACVRPCVRACVRACVCVSFMNLTIVVLDAYAYVHACGCGCVRVCARLCIGYCVLQCSSGKIDCEQTTSVGSANHFH